MARLYARMFLADQWVRDHADARKLADSTLFFDPIFRAAGVTFEEYDRSVHYYLDRPEKYSKILAEASEELRAEAAVLQMSVNAERAQQTERDRYRKLYRPTDFSADSLLWSAPGILWPGTASGESGRREHLMEKKP